ncbi:General transcription and DNA repair factor IIH subunit TFB5 [Plasmodiophora brassicae]|uniref:General transcription and DNA repair factor IIH subunit TFB5 n=1 Tax=Plasmodiophora brassicae TaxID=37360 RepID=A0A0G4IYF0_PLABS|nr:hypothetical protein PBRA_001414 [Plasmodiophora brassicae]SPQ94132.1 unnamed protein product [Plasmodiophora brassicae]
MVRLMRGRLIECDVALREYLRHLNATKTSFILDELDSRHLFVKDSDEIMAFLKTEIEKWHDLNSFEDEDDFESEMIEP